MRRSRNIAGMEGNRQLFTCVACNRTFTFWVPLANEHPKVTCYFCGHEFHPLGSPPPAEPHKEKEPVPAVN